MRRQSDIPNIKQFSRYCYYAGLGMGGFLFLFLFLFYYYHPDILHILPPDPFYSSTGYYCFGCGGTRAVNALLHGRILKSLHYHPFVLYAAVLYVLFMVSHTLNILTKGKVSAMRFRPGYFYFGAALIILQCLVKNFLKWRFGICL